MAFNVKKTDGMKILEKVKEKANAPAIEHFAKVQATRIGMVAFENEGGYFQISIDQIQYITRVYTNDVWVIQVGAVNTGNATFTFHSKSSADQFVADINTAIEATMTVVPNTEQLVRDAVKQMVG